MNDRTETRQAPQFAVVAMRDAAEKLRADATALLTEAEIAARQHVEAARQRAEEMRAAAAEIDADADRKQAERGVRQQRPETPAIGTLAPCPGPDCPVPVAWDGLGWTHAGATDCGVDLSGYVPQTAALTTQQDGGPQE